MKTYPRLGVNLDHVATLRQARKEAYPDMARAVEKVIGAGADQITIHLREDRRHIQDFDLEVVRNLTFKHQKLFNFEMACESEVLSLATKARPDWICLVPEKREELTTEGGLNLKDEKVFKKVALFCETLLARLPQVKISPFIEADLDLLPLIEKLPIHGVEVHTGSYAHHFTQGQGESDIQTFFDFSKEIKSLALSCHAGHGLTRENLIPLLEQKFFDEYNIGHWIIAESIFSGLEYIVKDLKNLMSEENACLL